MQNYFEILHPHLAQRRSRPAGSVATNVERIALARPPAFAILLLHLQRMSFVKNPASKNPEGYITLGLNENFHIRKPNFLFWQVD